MLELVNDVGKAVWLSLQDDWQSYLAAFIAVLVTLGGLFVVYSFVSSIVTYVRVRSQGIIPAIKLAHSWLGEKRMRERTRKEELRVKLADGIVNLVEDWKFKGEISTKEGKALYRIIAALSQDADYLPRVKHPKAIIAAIKGRHIDKTPVPLPDLQYSPAQKWAARTKKPIAA